jgi:hypothetical protein
LGWEEKIYEGIGLPIAGNSGENNDSMGRSPLYMNEPIYSGPVSSGPVSSRSVSSGPGGGNGTGWSLILIFACVALGFTASAADYERIAATGERNHAELLATECSSVEGQLEDLGKFLADPQTRLISMTRQTGFAASPGVIAWNTAQGHGYFLCDGLPILNAGHGYELWAIQGTNDPVKLATFDAKPGISVYPLEDEQGMSGKMRLELTAGPRSMEKNPVFAGDIE